MKETTSDLMNFSVSPVVSASGGALTVQQIPFGEAISNLFYSFIYAVKSAIAVISEYNGENLLLVTLKTLEDAGKNLAPDVENIKALSKIANKYIEQTSVGSKKMDADGRVSTMLENRMTHMEGTLSMLESVRDTVSEMNASVKMKDHAISIIDLTAERIYELYEAMEQLRNEIGQQHALTEKPLELSIDELRAMVS